jgi:hypothetical protein
MLRQCAWCLRLIDLAGKRLSSQPLPKLYEASHGMCSVCGTLWLEQVLSSLPPQVPSLYLEEHSDQRLVPMPQDASSTQYVVDLPIQYQEISTVPIVCESRSAYSPAEGPESLLGDDILDGDLTRVSHQSQT